MRDHHTEGELSCPPPTQAFCSRGLTQGTGLAPASSLPAGCSPRSFPGSRPRARPPPAPSLGLSLPLVGTPEDVTAARDARPGPGRAARSSPRELRYRPRPRCSRGKLCPGHRVPPAGDSPVGSCSSCLQLFPKDPSKAPGASCVPGPDLCGLRLPSPEQRQFVPTEIFRNCVNNERRD